VTVIALPTVRNPQSATPRPVSSGAWQTPIAGGDESWLGRTGDRFAMDVELPQLLPDPDALQWIAALVDSVGQIVSMPFTQMIDVGSPGAAVVDTAGQLGSTLKIRGATSGYTIRRGQFLNADDGSYVSLHMCTADTVIGSDGKATVPIKFPLRHSPADGASVRLAAPIIMGKLLGSEKGWTWQRFKARGIQFSVAEIK